MSESFKGVLTLGVVVLVAVVVGVVGATMQERAEARTAQAQAQGARAAEHEEALAAERRVEERVLASAEGAPTLEGLRHEAEEASEELTEREDYEAAWLSENAGALQAGEEAARYEANYLHALVGEARSEYDVAVWRMRALEAHEKLLAAREAAKDADEGSKS